MVPFLALPASPTVGGGDASCGSDRRQRAFVDGCVNVRDLGGLGQVRPSAVVRM
jgi:protein-tyrosine phosphatase